MAHGKDDGKIDRREKMTGNELAHEETEHGNVAQDKITQEEVVNNKVKITLIPEEEGEEEEEAPEEVMFYAAV